MAAIVRSTVCGVLVEVLKKHGIRNIFGLPSAQLAIMMDAFSRDPFFRYVTTRHEECAGHAAHGATVIEGEIAVCFGTVGPGATNMLPGVAAAWGNNIPLIAVVPNNQSYRISPDKDMLQAVDQLALYEPITKWRAQVRDPERAPELFERAIAIARSGRPGPVLIEIPVDITGLPCTYDLDSIPLLARPRPVPSRDEIAAALELLHSAKRPLLIAGGGVVRSGGHEAFRELAKKYPAPSGSSVQGWGVIDPDSPMAVGSPSWYAGHGFLRACQEADVVLAVGSKFGTWTPIGKVSSPMPAGQKVIQIDIDSEMLGKNVKATLGLVGDARETLRVLAEAIDSSRLSFDAGWIDEIVAARRGYEAEIDSIADTALAENGPQPTPAWMRELVRLIPDDAIVTTDGGQTAAWVMSMLRRTKPNCKFDSGMGHMGSAIPLGIGARVASGHKTPVFVITGDGSAGLTGQEFETMVRHGIKLVVIVMNDRAWGAYRMIQDHILQNSEMGITLTDVQFSMVAKGYGCDGERVERVADLEAALARATASPTAYVLDVVTETAFNPMDMAWAQEVIDGLILAPHAVERL
jgi:acetolactate synthase-1/2/3 large subunit